MLTTWFDETISDLWPIERAATIHSGPTWDITMDEAIDEVIGSCLPTYQIVMAIFWNSKNFVAIKKKQKKKQN